MTTKEVIISEIEKVTEPLLHEALDFIYFLKAKTIKESFADAVASESSLKKDWLKSEEDIAWQDL